MSAEATATPFDPSTGSYVLDGIGHPRAAHLFHALRIAAWVGGCISFCRKV
jgi:hypothetical protein